MLLDSLNINSLRVFERVFAHKSMTMAAKELGLTQSGVSQHIKNLENSLEISLFDRVKHRLIPTSDSENLAKNLQRYFRSIERELNQISRREVQLRGEVSIGIPLEFGNNFILPLLSEIGRQHPEISFSIKYGHSSEMDALLVNGELDFALIDTFTVDPLIITQPIWDETLSLCCQKQYLENIFGKGKIKHQLSTYDQLDYVDYIKGAPVLKMWFEHHLKKSFIPNARASLMDVQGMLRIIECGLGAGVLPLHVISRHNKLKNNLYVFDGGPKPLLNTVSMAYLDGRTLSSAARHSRDFILEKLPLKLR